MVTDISVRSVGSYIAEDRTWVIGEHGTDASDNVVLDFTTFTHANFTSGTYAGLIRAGCVLGKITATGKYGPYDPAASDGRQTAKRHLFNTVKIPANTATVASDAGLYHFFCREAGLPYASGPGAIDAAGKTALRQVEYV